MKRIEKLFVRLGLIDKATGPANKVFKTIDKINRRTQAGMAKVVSGGAGLYGVARSLKAMLSPSIEMDRAIGQVKSLDVADTSLKKLERTALRFSIRWGESATEFVSSAYDIQSAINGLTGVELSSFTNASGVLSKATKSDISTITDYVGTMYGIFQNQAAEMGKANWVNLLAGQTATAVQMFKTTGSEMSAAFVSLGADATSMKILMNEQMAILGTLQATMSGSEAGTKYKSFLAGVGKAQKTLGLEFTDSHGRMLPMIDILERIKGKFGNIDTVAKADLLQKAFGRKEAVGLIKLLMQDMGGLAKNIDKLGKVKGMNKAIEMANKMVDPYQRLEHGVNAVAISFGRVLQPALNPLIDSLTSGADTIVRWTELFPNLTKIIGTATLVVFGLVGVVSLFALIGGVAQLAVAGWNTVMLIGTGIMKVWSLKANIATAAAWLFNAALWANPVTWVVIGVVALIAALAAAVYWWDDITAAVVGFVNKGIEALPKAWAYVKNLFADNKWMQIVFFPFYQAINLVDWVIKNFNKIPQWWNQAKSFLLDNKWMKAIFLPFTQAIRLVDWVIQNFDKFPLWWSEFTSWLGSFNPFEAIGSAIAWVSEKWQLLKSYFADNQWMQLVFAPLTAGSLIIDGLISNFKKIPTWWSQFKNWISQLNPFDVIGKSMDWLIDKINLIPGVNISRNDFDPETVKSEQAPLRVTERVQLPQGGLIQEISNATNNNSNGMHIDNLEIKTEKVDRNFFEDELIMAAG